MATLLDQPRKAVLPPYVAYKNVFTPQECCQLIAAAKHKGMQPATTGKNTADPKVRISQVSWLYDTPQNSWAYKKLADVALDARTHWYPFHLSGFWEPLQVTQYTAAAKGHYSAHKDLAAGAASTRKLSLVCLLSPRNTFFGGDLLMLAKAGDDKRVSELKQGVVIAFAAWELHQVTQVTGGDDRFSLVTWLHGPTFA